jgi:cyclopropane-fatty-acyl-phospholipid synthase
LYIVRHIPEVQIDTITLSENQHAYVRAEVARQGFEDRIRVHLLDYREMPREWDGSFDRVVSIEMVENVGLDNVDTYLATIDRVLKRKNGAGVIQGISIPESRQLSRRDHVIHPHRPVTNLNISSDFEQDSLNIPNEWTLSRNG